MGSVSSLKSILLVVKGILEVGEDIVDIGRQIWEQFSKNYETGYSDENPSIVSKALHRMYNGSSPRIALVGMTSAGKSSLVNALFGQSIAEVKRTPDTTDCVIEARFPSDLIIFDTPGLWGEEELGYENITRLFLGLPQEEDSKLFSSVRCQVGATEVSEWSLEELSNLPALDAIIFTIDISRVLSKNDRKSFKIFFLELQKQFNGRIVVAGTHFDELKKLSEEEIQGQLDSYNKIFYDQIRPVSSISGEGLSELVVDLFRTMPEKVSPAKLQEALVSTRKLNRLSFILTEVSVILAEIILLKGNQKEDIMAGCLGLFALICNHYSVDEETWLKCNGDALKIGEKAKETGTRRSTYRRPPQDFFEWLKTIFGGVIHGERTEFSSLGVNGLKLLLPKVYKLLYDLNETHTLEFSQGEIQDRVDSYKVDNDKKVSLEQLIKQENSEEITSHIEVLMAGLFPDSI